MENNKKGEPLERSIEPAIEEKELLRLTAGGIVVNMEGKILLVQQKGGNWVFPKGGINAEEDPLVATRREILEETGIEEKDLAQVDDFEEKYERPDTDKAHVLQRISMFLFKTGKMEVMPMPDFEDEIIEARWVAKDRVAELLTAPKDKEFFLNILGKI